MFLTATERQQLADAFNAVEASGVIDQLADEHAANFNSGIHWGSAFLPWHRHFLLRLEAAFAAAGHPGVMVPFWDWTRSDSRSLDVEPWKSFFGGRNNTGGQFDHWGYNRLSAPPAPDAQGFNMLPILRDDASDIRAIVPELDKPTFQEFRSLERWGSHPPGHVWTGGTMAGGRSPADPLFWLHHCNIDRLWAIWQRNNPGAQQYNTVAAAGDAVPAAMVDLNDPMVGGATPASMLDHLVHGYTYAADIRLEAAWEAEGLGTLPSGDPSPVDFYIRDSATDTGAPPSPTPHWQSPDIWVRNNPPGAGENPSDGHQAPIVNQPNHVYVRVHNRGGADTQPATVDAYRCTPGTGMLWPEHFEHLGTLALPGPVATNGNVELGPYIWTPTVEGHECLLAVVRSLDEDPGSLETLHGTPAVPAGTAASLDHSVLVRFDNNVGQRNVAPILAAPGTSTRMGLRIRGLDHLAEHTVRIDASALPRDTAISVRLANGVLATGSTRMRIVETNSRFTTLGMAGGATATIDDIDIAARDSFDLTVGIDFSFNAVHLRQYPIVIQQLHAGQVIGAYTVEITAIKQLDDYVFGNPRSRELHITSCPFWPVMNKSRLRPFDRVADGVARGYNGCRFCIPSADTG